MKPIQQLKDLPVSPEIEVSLISCLVQWPQLVRELDIISGHFHVDRYKKIFAVISALSEDGIPSDPALVWQGICDRKWEGLCGPRELFFEEVYVATTQANARFYLEKLDEIRRARSFLMQMSALKERVKCGEKIDDILMTFNIEEGTSTEADEIISGSSLMTSVETLYREDIPVGVRTGWASIDPHFKPRPGELTLITGIPGHGKTSWLDALLINLARVHDWKSIMFSAENLPFENHVSSLLEIKIGKPFREGFHERMTGYEVQEGMRFISDHFIFLNPGKPSLERILSLAEKSLMSTPANILVIDPWNEMEHKWEQNQTETQYISDCLMKIRRFGRKHNLHIFLVAHPMKPKKDPDGSYPPPTPYDISGGAHWRNKADNCITVYRHISKSGEEDPETEIHITKIRFREVGKIGVVKLNYDRITGRYCSI